MPEIENPKEFADTYLLMFNKLWASDAELDKLRANPHQYAIDAGLPVEAGSTIQVDETPMDGLFTTEQLVTDWNSTPGVHILHAPPAPTFDPAELTDLDLDTVAGGAAKSDDKDVTVVIACYVAKAG